MTDAKLKKKNSKAKEANERISTHPSYKEYTWDTLTVPGVAPRPVSHKNGIGQQMSAGTAVGGTTGTFGRVPPQQGAHTGEFTAQRGNVGVAAPTKTNKKKKTAVKVKAEKPAKVKTKIEYLTTKAESEKRYSFPVSLVLMGVCATVLIMSIITTGVQINEITGINSGLESRYSELEEREDELRRLLEVRDDLRIVEKMAKEELGMVKKDQVERYYLSVHKEDRIEIIEEQQEDKPSFIDGIKEFGNSIIDRIRGFLGM